MDTLQRQWAMLQQIPRYPRRISTSELRGMLRTEGFDIDLRTIQRDLKSLSIPFPIVTDEGKPAGWSWSKDAESFDLPGMDPTTALTLTMADRFLTRLLPQSSMASLSPQMKRAERVLTNMAADEIRNWPDKVRSISRSQPLLPPQTDSDVIATVTEGLLRNCKIEGRYRNRRGEERTRTFSPLGLVYADQLIYLIALVPEYDHPRSFALHRFLSAESTECKFQPPATFDLDEFLASQPLGFPVGGGGTMKIDLRFFDNAAVHLLETPLSYDQTQEYESENCLRICATVADTKQLRWWLLGFGDSVEVLAPDSLRQELVETAKAVVARYR